MPYSGGSAGYNTRPGAWRTGGDDAPAISFEYLREQTVGADATFVTPFGERTMVYCDYTASGRCLHFIENYLLTVLKSYANTHTEDDVTGRNMTRLLHDAECIIKRSVNAGPDGRIIAVGTGATGAIDKLQQILGVACPPATRRRIDGIAREVLGAQRFDDLQRASAEHLPVVFVGPYEHHSNEVSWRQGYASVVEVALGADGSIDLDDLERLLSAPEYRDRPRIGSFSAASNVTGMLSPVRDIARLLHRYGAIACFDYAASAPYEPIDMNPAGDPEARIDAIFVSPHKFLGGPGSSGVLVFNQGIYPSELPPTVAAGGTVDYVSPDDQDFVVDIEEREKAGTPGVIQTIKAALAFDLKDEIGTARIAGREHALLAGAIAHWSDEPAIEILGNPDPSRRTGIVSFNVKDPRGRYLHPKFVTALLNDLFGIQSRAGCSCAGPYGHRLLGIDRRLSGRYRQCVAAGHGGLKPGWCRIGFHYTMDDVDAEYVINAVSFVGQHGYRFLSQYRFDLATGAWEHRNDPTTFASLSVGSAMQAAPLERTAMSADRRRRLYRSYLNEAQEHALQLEGDEYPSAELKGDLAELQFFALDPASVETCCDSMDRPYGPCALPGRQRLDPR